MNAYRVDRDRWARLTIHEQMGNISGEVGRSLQAKRLGDATGFEHGLARALDLLDATVETLTKDRQHRATEILRAKDEYLRLFARNPIDESAAASLERYFHYFAIAARITR